METIQTKDNYYETGFMEQIEQIEKLIEEISMLQVEIQNLEMEKENIDLFYQNELSRVYSFYVTNYWPKCKRDIILFGVSISVLGFSLVSQASFINYIIAELTCILSGGLILKNLIKKVKSEEIIVEKLDCYSQCIKNYPLKQRIISSLLNKRYSELGKLKTELKILKESLINNNMLEKFTEISERKIEYEMIQYYQALHSQNVIQESSMPEMDIEKNPYTNHLNHK